MKERTRTLKQIITYTLLFVGILGIGFLIYIVVDHLSPNTQATDPTISANAPLSETVTAAPEEPSEIPIGIRVGQRAPDFQLRSLENNDVALSDFLGKVVILDFWATWCTPCRLTMPGLEDIARTSASDVTLLGVNLDRKEETAVDYLASNDFDAMIALHQSYDAAYRVFERYGGGGIPKTYVIDRDGIIRYVGHPASLSRQTIEQLF